MAIGLDKVNHRKANRATTRKTAFEAEPWNDAWSTRGLAREGRSTRRERSGSIGDLNTLWLDWSTCVTGAETPNRLLKAVRQLLDVESFIFEFLVYELQIPARAKKRIFEIRSHAERILYVKKLIGEN